MKVQFKEANLYYGEQRIPVENNEFHPFEDFDTEGDLMEQAFKAMAAISYASGGFLAKDASLTVHDEYCLVHGQGFSVKWGGATSGKEMLRIIDNIAVHRIEFDVRADIDPEGWKRAKRLPHKQEA